MNDVNVYLGETKGGMGGGGEGSPLERRSWRLFLVASSAGVLNVCEAEKFLFFYDLPPPPPLCLSR